MNEITSTEQQQQLQQQYIGGGSDPYEDYRFSFNTDESLGVNICSHQENLLSQWASEQQQQTPIASPQMLDSILDWLPAQSHEYHPGLSPVGSIDSVSPILDQSQFTHGQHILTEPPRRPDSTMITSIQPIPTHQLVPMNMLQQPQKLTSICYQSSKTNEKQGPKTYNCTACKKWFTSSGHLKRHYKTTLHKNAIEQSNLPDPANMPINGHYHPSGDANLVHGSSPQLVQHPFSIGSPAQLVAGVPSMVSSSMGGTSMPHQPYANAFPPRDEITTSISDLIESIISKITTTGDKIPHQSHQQQHQQHQQSQDLTLPVLETFSNHQSSLPSCTEFDVTGFFVTHNQQYQIETNNIVPQLQDKEEINPNIIELNRHSMMMDEQQMNGVTTKECEVTSTNIGSHYISQKDFHKCIECNKVFNKPCYLTQHNKSFHSGYKPFKCNQCGKRFALEYLCAEHQQKHTGEKPYKCEKCPKQFNHNTDLRRHMYLHIGEKPYSCVNCGKGFVRKDHMMKHLERHEKKSNNHHNSRLRN